MFKQVIQLFNSHPGLKRLPELQVADGGGSSRADSLLSIGVWDAAGTAGAAIAIGHRVDRAHGLDYQGCFHLADGKLICGSHLPDRLGYEPVGIRLIQQVTELQINHMLRDYAVHEGASLDSKHTPDQQVVRVHVVVDYLHPDD